MKHLALLLVLAACRPESTIIYQTFEAPDGSGGAVASSAVAQGSGGDGGDVVASSSSSGGGGFGGAAEGGAASSSSSVTSSSSAASSGGGGSGGGEPEIRVICQTTSGPIYRCMGDIEEFWAASISWPDAQSNVTYFCHPDDPTTIAPGCPVGNFCKVYLPAGGTREGKCE